MNLFNVLILKIKEVWVFSFRSWKTLAETMLTHPLNCILLPKVNYDLRQASAV